MLLFTYNDYLDCIQNQKIQKIIHLENKRNKIENTLKNEKTQTEYYVEIDKLIERLIKREEEIANLINDFFKVQTWSITKDSIKKYNMKNKKILYKYKGKQIYFLIKIQKEFDYHISYIILTYCIEFIKKWKIKNPNNKQAPIIVPIVIYIGNKRWNRKENKNIKYTSFKENCINFSYNLVDLSKYEALDLIKHKSLISNITALKKHINNCIKEQIIQMIKNKVDDIEIYLQIKNIEEYSTHK